jgi:hypothetical protein
MRIPDNAARSLNLLSLGTKETLYQTRTVVYGTGKHVTPVTMNTLIWFVSLVILNDITHPM